MTSSDERNKLLDEKLFHTEAEVAAHKGRRHHVVLANLFRATGDSQSSMRHWLAASDYQEVLEKHKMELQAIRQQLGQEEKLRRRS